MEYGRGFITFNTNNKREIWVHQYNHDDPVTISTFTDNGVEEKRRTIPSAVFVQLIAMYDYIKENDIHNDFVNPHGTSVEVL